MVVDLKTLKDACERTAFILPDIELQLKCTSFDVLIFALFDALSGFDLLSVDLRDILYFVTTIFGDFLLLGAPMGFCNILQV